MKPPTIRLHWIASPARFLMLLMPSFAYAQLAAPEDVPASEKYYYDFHPLSTLTLGGSFDPNHLDEGKLSPIRVLEYSRPDGVSGSIQTQFDLHLVNSAEQLRKIVQFDAKADVRYFRVQANARFSSLNSYSFNQQDINLVITARSEYSRRAITKFEFTDEALDIVDDPKQFKRTYGTRVVTMERLGASVYVLLKISNVSTAMRKKIEADFSMNAKFGPAKVSVSSAFKNEVRQASSESRTDLTVISTADPDGISGLTQFIDQLRSTGYEFETLMDKVAEYVSKMKPADAKPIGYFTTSIENLGLPRQKVSDVLFSQRLETAMARVADAYKTTQSELDLIAALRSAKHPAHVYLTEPKDQELHDSIKPLQRLADTLIDKQEELVKRYDDLHRGRKLDRIEKKYDLSTGNKRSRWFGLTHSAKKWSRIFDVPVPPQPATRFLANDATMRLCSYSGKVILKAHQIASVKLRVSWIAADQSQFVNITEPSLYANAAGLVAIGSGTNRLDTIWGRNDELTFTDALFLAYSGHDQLSNAISNGPNPLSADGKYDVDLVVKNTIGDEVALPLGVYFFLPAAGVNPSRREMAIPHHLCN